MVMLTMGLDVTNKGDAFTDWVLGLELNPIFSYAVSE